MEPDVNNDSLVHSASLPSEKGGELCRSRTQRVPSGGGTGLRRLYLLPEFPGGIRARLNRDRRPAACLDPMELDGNRLSSAASARIVTP